MVNSLDSIEINVARVTACSCIFASSPAYTLKNDTKMSPRRSPRRSVQSPFQLQWIQWHQFVCTDRVDFCHEFSTIPGFPQFCWHPFPSQRPSSRLSAIPCLQSCVPGRAAKNGRIGCVATSKWGDAPTCRSKEAKCQRFQGTAEKATTALSVDQIFRVVSSDPLTRRWPVRVVTLVKTSTESPRILQPFVPLDH